MSQELNALLERINQDGIEKARAEREKLVAAARAEADGIIASAKAEADALVTAARRESELLERRGREALKQAARDTLLSLAEQLRNRMREVVKACVVRDADAEAFAAALAAWVKSELENDNAHSVRIDVSVKDVEVMRKHLLGALGEDLRRRVEIAPIKDFDSGFVLGFSDSDMGYDFSDTALADVLCEFLSPKLADIVSAAARESGVA